METIPTSKLTTLRPDLWSRAIDLATGTTGYTYLHKAPAPDGTITACGGGAWRPSINGGVCDPAPSGGFSEEELKRRIRLHDEYRKKNPDEIWAPHWVHMDDYRKRVDELERLRKGPEHKALSAAVPDGAMEWLLHEVGHWVVASAEERLLPDYGLSLAESGHDADREWEAWAFEEIVLAPFGPARLVAPPPHRAGVGYSKDAIPAHAFRHAEQQIEALGLDLERWRLVYRDWLRWGVAVGQVARDSVLGMN